MSFTLQDLLGTLLGLVIGGLFFLPPGIAVGYLTNVLSFRCRPVLFQVLLAVVLSFAVDPALTYLAWRFLSLNAVWLVYAVSWLFTLGVLGRAIAKQGLAPMFQATILGRRLRATAAIGIAWSVVAVVSLIDLQFGHALYFSVVAVDYRAHIAIIDAIARTGVPPANPSFFPGQPVELYYYYFWFMLGSLVDLLGGPLVGARGASFGTTIWSGLGLLSIIALYVQPTDVHERIRSWNRSAIAIGLLLVSGVDVIPVVIESVSSLTIGKGMFYSDLEWWNEQITAWLGAMVWVPHHIAALVAGFTAILLLRNVHQARGHKETTTLGALAGVGFASAAGTSIWVTFTFAVFLAIWLLVSFRMRWLSEITAAVVAGVVATTLATPYLLDLQHANQLGGIPMAPTVRAFLPAHQLLSAIGWGSGGVEYFFDSLLLPLNYSMELGFFAVAAVVYWHQRNMRGDRLTVDDVRDITLLAVSAVICTFLKSTINNNDLGYRSAMIGQFILLIWATEPTLALLSVWPRHSGLLREVSERRNFWVCTALPILLILGVATSGYDLLMLRIYPVLSDVPGFAVTRETWLPRNQDLGRRTYAVRAAYQWANDHLPKPVVLQHNPNEDVEIFHALYAQRQVAAADYSNGVLFGIPEVTFERVAKPIAAIFADSPAQRLVDIDRSCDQFGISALVVKDTDPVFSDRRSWLWQRHPLYENAFVRIVGCGSARTS